LVHAFIDQASHDLGKKVRGITPEALAALAAYRWPGNVRELKKLIERAVILTPKGEYIDTSVLPQGDVSDKRRSPLERWPVLCADTDAANT
jgi:transcriptional regulator with PAS, ATPase and Fis domain